MAQVYCIVCGNMFEAERSDALYCGKDHALVAYNLRRSVIRKKERVITELHELRSYAKAYPGPLGDLAIEAIEALDQEMAEITRDRNKVRKHNDQWWTVLQDNQYQLQIIDK